jgi:hypothetical protein
MSSLAEATFSSVLLVNGHSNVGGIFAEVTPLLSLENHSRIYALPNICSPKATFDISKVPVAFFLTLKQNFMQARCAFKSTIFKDASELQMEQHTLVLNRILLGNHTCYYSTASNK